MSDQPAATHSKVVLQLSHEPIVVSLSEFKGALRLDLRHYDYNASGELVPTRSGVNVLLDDAEALYAAIETALEHEGETQFPACRSFLPVGVEVNLFKHRKRLDVRHYHQDKTTRRLSPTKKGINLDYDEGENLLKAMRSVLDGGAQEVTPAQLAVDNGRAHQLEL